MASTRSPRDHLLQADFLVLGTVVRCASGLLPDRRRLAQKRRIHWTSINGESWLVVYGLPVAQRFLNRNREGQSDKQRVRGTR